MHIISMLLNLFLPIKNTVTMKNKRQYHIGVLENIFTFMEEALKEADSTQINIRVIENINRYRLPKGFPRTM